MIHNSYNAVRDFFVLMLRKRSLNQLWHKQTKGLRLKKLSPEQKRQIQDYYKSCIGQTVTTRWHQLFYTITGEFNYRYLPFDVFIEMYHRLSPWNYQKIIDDKNMYRQFLSEFNIPDRFVECSRGVFCLPQNGNNQVSFEDVVLYCQNLGDCIIKPSRDSSAGIGVRLLSLKDGYDVKTGEDIRTILKSYKQNFLIEKKMEEMDSLCVLNPSSCNTIRVHTFRNRKEERVEFVSAHVRIGRSGSVVDNGSAGGIRSKVNSEGRLSKFACATKPQYAICDKTDSGVVIKDHIIDGFEKIVETAVSAHQRIPWFDLIGWDMLIDSEGRVVIIEFNPNPDMKMQQLIYKDSVLGDMQDTILKQAFNK